MRFSGQGNSKEGDALSDSAIPQKHRRGAKARSPWRLGWRGLWDALRRVGARLGPDRVGLVAAGVAFFGLLAIFPGLASLFAIAGLVLDTDMLTRQFQTSLAAMPESARAIILGQVRSVATAAPGGLSLTAIGGLAFALFLASRGIANLMDGLNLAYEEKEERNIFVLTAVTLALTLFTILAITVALAIVAVIPLALALLGDVPNLQAWSEMLRWPVLVGLAALTFTVLYRYGPSRRNARWRWLAPGGVLACLLWIGTTAAFGWYVETLGNYSETFGAIGGVIVLMLWLWISTFMVLFGALVDAELEAQTGRDSTVGPDRPIGQRGAVKADTCEGCAPDE